jgi:hypothetical protein
MQCSFILDLILIIIKFKIYYLLFVVCWGLFWFTDTINRDKEASKISFGSPSNLIEIQVRFSLNINKIVKVNCF